MTGQFHYEKDNDNIVTVTMDMSGPVNAMNDEYIGLMSATVERLEKERDDIAGVVLTSAKKTFFAGGDIKNMLKAEPGKDEEGLFLMCEEIKGMLAKLEKLGKPVVAAINGAALGGGYEICLACHHRVALNSPAVQLGLPEVSLGLLPGGGGIVRLVSKLGVEKAIMPLLEGTRFNVAKAQAAGLIEEVADTPEEMMAKAKAWIKANPEASNPWNEKGFKIPGGDMRNPKVAQMVQGAIPMLLQKTRGLVPAPARILDVIAQYPAGGFRHRHAYRKPRSCGVGYHAPGQKPDELLYANESGQRWWQPPQRHRQNRRQKSGCAGCGYDGAGYRLRVSQSRYRGGAERYQPGGGGQGQGLLRKTAG